ncbi:MAG: hypothetical protein GY707_07575 [Desulfobacteraceae bacterium]|nr:hypothetical protein [Desulfobacteraceae bacterium]
MSHYADDIKRIAKQKDPKSGLGDAKERTVLAGDSVPMVSLDEDENSLALTPPLTIEILTYDDTKDIEFKDTSDAVHTIKTALTAKITDADGIEYEIDTITYATP